MAEQVSTTDLRRLYNQRWTALETERSSWVTHWEEISRFVLPRSGRFFVQDRNRGDKRHNHIIDSTATKSLEILAAGMMSGMTSPARPWFKLATADQDMNRYGPVKIWLEQTTRIMRDIFTRSNTYRAFHQLYRELGAFGTAASIIVDDFEDVIRHYPQTVGVYALACDARGTVKTFARKYQMTVEAMVQEFGREACSNTVQRMFDDGKLDAWVDVMHIIEPRASRDIMRKDAKNMPFSSCYFEPGSDSDRLLRESGFDMFPAICPRWDVVGEDIYGESPAMRALGDVKQLQQEQLRKAQGIDYMVKPPIQAPTSLKNVGVDSLPGGVSYYDSAQPQGGIRTAFEVRLDLNALREDIQDVRQMIRSAFYADLFLMLANNDNPQMTATEVATRNEEKMQMLGPVLERLHNEMLDPKIDITFSRMLKAGIVPPPPEELRGVDLNVEYVSMLAQAQRAVGTNAVDRFVGNLGMVAQMKPDVLDKFDADEWAEAYSDMLGVDPKLIVGGKQVGLVRQQRAQAQAAAQQAQQQNVQSQTVKNIGSVDPQAMGDVMQMFSGYTTQ